MNTRAFRAALMLGVLALALAAAWSDAGAIPAFARKYQMSCTTCHAPFPRLKPYGEEFAARGFRLEAAQEPARATYDVGDPLLALPRDLPLAVRMEGFFSWKEDARARTDFESPWVWKVLSGGPIGKQVSYYFYFLAEQGAVTGLEDAYLQVNDVLGSGFNLMAGQFQVCDPLFKRELRLERYDYLIYKTKVGFAPINLTYDRGIVLSRVLPGGFDFSAQIVNGNGIGGVGEEGISDFVRFDDDRDKNVAARLARWGGSVRLGAFGYWGRSAGVPLDLKRADAPGFTNETFYIGPDLVANLGAKAQLNAQVLYREDDDPFFTGNENKHVTRGGFAELHLFPRGEDGRLACSALYNLVESDDDSADRETASLTVNHLVARNIRLMLEGGRDLQEKKARLTVGLIAAF
jgi:hypothetical protein